MIDRDDRLWLLVSRRCNLRCGFCPLEFPGQDMTLDTARRAIAAYRRHLPADAVPAVKFFGGEPLLNWPVLRTVIEESRGSGLSFQITTNGILLDAEKISYLKSRPEVETTLSFRTDGAAGLPGVWFTYVLTQNETTEGVVAKMRTLLSDGYRRFNFMPAYYTLWSAAQLRELDRTFAALTRLFSGLRERGVEHRLKNSEVTGPVPLANLSLTVDLDGTVYSSGLIECRGVEPFREEMRCGSIERWPARMETDRDGRVLRDVAERWAGPEIWDSTLRADDALTRMVDAVAAAGRRGSPALA